MHLATGAIRFYSSYSTNHANVQGMSCFLNSRHDSLMDPTSAEINFFAGPLLTTCMGREFSLHNSKVCHNIITPRHVKLSAKFWTQEPSTSREQNVPQPFFPSPCIQSNISFTCEDSTNHATMLLFFGQPLKVPYHLAAWTVVVRGSVGNV
ncbi:hypothetical protein VNO77_34463 [Canavalia gladiata]|uniref:Uncharacterized protein n=1 Tax=Canavalia gladiata TaxID=3824 RepID=A0AAN9KG75_CANGL